MSNPFFDTDDFDFEFEKHKLIKNLDYLKSMLWKNRHFIRNGLKYKN